MMDTIDLTRFLEDMSTAIEKYGDENVFVSRSNIRKLARAAGMDFDPDEGRFVDAWTLEALCRSLQAITRLQADLDAAVARAEKAEVGLRGVRADICNENGLNTHSIVCTVWHANCETTVDFIDAALDDGGVRS